MSSIATGNIISKTYLFGFGSMLGIGSIIIDNNNNDWNTMSDNSKINRMMGYGISSQFLLGTILSYLKKI